MPEDDLNEKDSPTLEIRKTHLPWDNELFWTFSI